MIGLSLSSWLYVQVGIEWSVSWIPAWCLNHYNRRKQTASNAELIRWIIWAKESIPLTSNQNKAIHLPSFLSVFFGADQTSFPRDIILHQFMISVVPGRQRSSWFYLVSIKYNLKASIRKGSFSFGSRIQQNRNWGEAARLKISLFNIQKCIQHTLLIYIIKKTWSFRQFCGVRVGIVSKI